MPKRTTFVRVTAQLNEVFSSTEVDTWAGYKAADAGTQQQQQQQQQAWEEAKNGDGSASKRARRD